MIFNITVLKSATTSKNGANGKPIQTLELTYTNGTSGAIESKKLVIFYNKVVCNALANAKMDDVYTITSEKEGDFWVWKEAVQAAPGQDAPVVVNNNNAPAKAAYTPSSKSTYETPEERAIKQVLIVRQSSLKEAVSVLTIGAKIPPSRELVFQEAQAFVDWVYQTKQEALVDMEDDIPE